MKTDTLNFRIDPRVKHALRVEARHESCSLANMIEVMVLEFCQRCGIELPEPITAIPDTHEF